MDTNRFVPEDWSAFVYLLSTKDVIRSTRCDISIDPSSATFAFAMGDSTKRNFSLPGMDVTIQYRNRVIASISFGLENSVFYSSNGRWLVEERTHTIQSDVRVVKSEKCGPICAVEWKTIPTDLTFVLERLKL
jgi:hypothetical protein